MKLSVRLLNIKVVFKKVNISDARKLKFRLWDGEEYLFMTLKSIFLTCSHDLKDYIDCDQFLGLDKDGNEVYENDEIYHKNCPNVLLSISRGITRSCSCCYATTTNYGIGYDDDRDLSEFILKTNKPYGDGEFKYIY